jgi:hypothetical protein
MGAARRRGTLVDPSAQSERGHGLRAVGLLASKLAAPVVAKRGGGVLVRLKADWASIVGPEWALVAWPIAFGRDGALKLRSVPAAALELQHRAPLLIDRINVYFGRSAVSRLILIQQALPRPLEPRNIAPRQFAAGESEALGRRLAGIHDPELRAALVRLGNAVAGADR